MESYSCDCVLYPDITKKASRSIQQPSWSIFAVLLGGGSV